MPVSWDLLIFFIFSTITCSFFLDTEDFIENVYPDKFG